MGLAQEIAKVKKEITDSQQHRKELSERLNALEAQAQRVSHHHVLPRHGIDYSFARPPINELKGWGFSFVGRYIMGEGKAITRVEAEELTKAGIDIFVMFEQGARDAAGGYNQGIADAHLAINALDQLKPKGDPPIYFVCDFDAAGEGLTDKVLEYIRGAVHTIGWYRVGLYAGYEVLVKAHAENRCKFFYQTLAWSGGRWLPEAQVRQTAEEINLLNNRVDLDTAIAADFGQFRV